MNNLDWRMSIGIKTVRFKGNVVKTIANDVD